MQDDAKLNSTTDQPSTGTGGIVAFSALGVVGLGGAFVLGWQQGDGLRYFLHAYLTSYCFFLSISLGALFFVALQHATRAGWSVTVRRLAELLAAGMPYLILLFLPIAAAVLLGAGELYPWNDPRVVAESELLQHKTVYLSAGFFAIRAVAYLAIWGFFARFYFLKSVEQDSSGEKRLTLQMEKVSPAVLVVFALTVTFASFDWLMSLSPEWFSTIFGVYFFAGAIVGATAAVILLAMALQSFGRLGDDVTVEHYHDLGKLLFSFVVFWGYIAFSQYLLIWYGNIPEETVWYQVRQTGNWTFVTLALLFGGLLIPFMGLLPRWARRQKAVLAFWAVWMLVFHFVDVYWLVMPSFSPKCPVFGPIDVGCLIGIGGAYLAGVLWLGRNKPLVPVGDPRLDESRAFENNF